MVCSVVWLGLTTTSGVCLVYVCAYSSILLNLKSGFSFLQNPRAKNVRVKYSNSYTHIHERININFSNGCETF